MCNHLDSYPQCEKDNMTRMARLKAQKTERTKKARIDHKKSRAVGQSKMYAISVTPNLHFANE